MRLFMAIVMILHGFAHLPGFLVPWRVTVVKAMPYRTTLLAGRIDVGDLGIRIVGALWLATLAAYVATGVGAIAGAPWWSAAAAVTTVLSLLLGLMSMPEARVGVVLDVVLLVVLAMAGPLGWFVP